MSDFSRPFRGADFGVTGHRRAKFHRVLRGVYVDPSVDVTARVKAEAAWQYCRGVGVLGGRSAAAALGVRYLDERRRTENGWQSFDPEPAVLYRPRAGSASTCAGLTVHRADLPPEEVVDVGGMRVTSPARTGFDLGRWPASAHGHPESRKDLDQRVVLLDALCNRMRMEPSQIGQLALRHPRAAGLAGLRAALELADAGAESPPETHLRLLVIRNGFPRPQTQPPVHDRAGRFFAHIDLGWPEWKVGFEYDGKWHGESQEQKDFDVNRYADYHDTGWRVITVNKTLLYRTQATLINRAWDYLAAAGAPV